jgi:imidazolonepropionase-like amidohydrolase
MLRRTLRGLAAILVLTSGSASRAAPDGEALALVHARLVDGTGTGPVPDAVVVIRGDRVIGAGAAGAVEVPAGARVVDLGGATLLPGLVNAHVHAAYDAEQLRTWARAGVTTVRDEGPFDPTGFLARRDALGADPRNATIVAATPIITVSGGYGWAHADSPEAMRTLVHAYADRGVDLVKTALEEQLQGRSWTLPTREEVSALVAAAHGRGRRVSIHVSRAAMAEWALEAGADDLAHMVVDRVDDPLLGRIAARGVIWVPTLELWRCVDAKHHLTWAPVALDNLARFHRAGGTIALGTDFAGYACDFDRGLPITELLAMQEAGLSPMEVLVAATRSGARACGREAELGTIAAGKRADLVAVRGDPLRDLHALAEPLLVVHRGVIIRDDRPDPPR